MKKACINCIHSSLDEDGDLECTNEKSEYFGDWVDEVAETDCDDFTGGNEEE